MSKLTRRGFLGASGSVLALAAMGRPAFAQTADIRHFWWGNPERDKRTFAVIDIFNGEHPDIHVSGETLGFSDYFTKLTTQIAGGSMPDVIQMGYGVMLEYVDKGTLKPLDEAIAAGTIDTSKIDPSGIAAGTFHDKVYGLTIGANCMAAFYNMRLFTEAGVDADPISWTYDQLKALSIAIKEKTGVAGTDDLTADWGGFGVYCGQRGFASQFTPDGQFAFGVDVLIDYWNMWKDMREAGATPAAEDTASVAGISDLDKMGIVTGKSAISYAWSNQLVGTQALMQDKLGAGIRPLLSADAPSGQSIQPSQFICLTRDSKNDDAALTYMNAFVNSPEMTAVLGLERGIPQQSDVRAALEPDLTDAEATSVAYFDAVQPRMMPLAPPAPAGNRECEEAFEQRSAVAVLLGQGSIEDNAQQFMDEAADILRRAQ